MGQNDGAGAGPDGCAGQGGPRLVGQVAVVTQDAPLEGVGVGAGLDPVHVVVGFHHQKIRTGHAGEDRFGDHPQVGDHGGLPAAVRDGVAHGFRRVVEGGEGLHRQTAHGEGPAGGAGVEHILQGGDAVAQMPSGAGAGVDRQPELLGQGGQTGDVVGMLVGDQHPRQGGGVHPQVPEGPADTPAGDARVHEQVGLSGGEQQAVAGGAAGQGGECQQDHRSYVSKSNRKGGGNLPPP